MVWCVADELPQEEGVQNHQAIAVKVPTASQFDGLASGKGGEGIYTTCRSKLVQQQQQQQQQQQPLRRRA